jgi:glycosyltransferase involved in cell wall biosynthesis
MALTPLPAVVMLIGKTFQRPDVPRSRQETQTLLEAGYPVYVFAWDRDAEVPALENVDGATVRSFRTVKLTKFSGRQRFGLALGGMIFQMLLFFEIVKLIGQLKQRPIVHAHDVNTLLPACFLRMLRLCSGLVYDCHEFTYGVYYEWFNVIVASVVRIIEERCVRYADAAITVSDWIAAYLRRFNSATEVVYNCPRIQDIPKLSKKEARIRLGLPTEAFIVSSVGMIRYDCRQDLLLAVASSTKERGIHYLIVGDGPLASQIRQAAEKANCACLTILPRVPREVALCYVSASDLTWAVYRNRAESFNPRMTIPWKFFESLACGVPVIVESGTLRAELIKNLKCGIVLESDDPRDISDAILSLAKNHDQFDEMCAKAKCASTALGFSWEAMSTRLTGVYKRLLSAEPWMT